MKNHILKISLSINLILIVVLLLCLIKLQMLPSKDGGLVNQAIETVCDGAVAQSGMNALKAYEGPIAAVDFTTKPEAALFKTAIEQQVVKGVNFAGHYSVATWGCGTECEGFAIVDVVTGKIVEYEPRIPLQASNGLVFSVTSNTLVFNPRPSTLVFQTLDEIIKSDFEARKGRIYYLLVENENSEAFLSTFCVENIYDGLI